MRIAFLGTPDFALPSLKMLKDEGHALCVFTQPDKPKGRNSTPAPPPVKRFAQENCITVYQPQNIRNYEGLAMLKDFSPELMISVAYGQLLSEENLLVPKYGCINVHGSLLPKYRGAAPIQWAIINGEQYTGITTMQTELGLDTGPILLSKELEILPEETAGGLYVRMADLGSNVLKDTLALLYKGQLNPIPQDECKATKCQPLKKEDGRLDFQKTAQELHNLIRGVNPWPGAYAFHNYSQIKIWRSRLTGRVTPKDVIPGHCYGDAKCGLFIACKDELLEILEIQIPGCRRMEARSCLCGRQLDGERFL